MTQLEVRFPPREGGGVATAGDLLDLVRSGRASTRSDLRELTGLSRTAVVARVSALLEAGLLQLGEELASTGGRPPGALVFNHDAGVVLAVAVGRSRSQLSVFDLEGRELVGDTQDHEVGTGPEVLMPQVVERLRHLVEGVDPPVLGIGMSLPGTVDDVRRTSRESPVMSGWHDVELAPYLAELADAPLYLANDADALARSEQFGPGERLRDVLVVKASTGLGMGVVADGRVLSGHLGAAGEIGHTRLESGEQLPCRCGATGCLETVAAGWALVQQLVDSGVEAGHVRDLVTHALRGDAVARALLRESGRRVGEVLAVAINLLNPQAVVIGGDMGQAFDLYTAGVRESVYARSTALATRDLQFLPATHGEAAGLVGCAALAIEHVLSPAAVDATLAG